MAFQNLTKIEMTLNENRLFGRHFETVQHFIYLFIYLFIFFLQNCDFL